MAVKKSKGDEIRRKEYVKATIVHCSENANVNNVTTLLFYLGGYAPDFTIGEVTGAIIELRDEKKITI